MGVVAMWAWRDRSWMQDIAPCVALPSGALPGVGDTSEKSSNSTALAGVGAAGVLVCVLLLVVFLFLARRKKEADQPDNRAG